MKNKPIIAAWLIMLAMLLFWCYALSIKYFSFGYFDWDLAFFNQAMWSLLHGSAFTSLFNVNFFGNHSNFIAFVFLPFYYLFPSALSLIYLKVAIFCLGALPIFLIAKEEINGKWGVFFMLLYFLYPPLNFALIYEFDWETISGLLIPLTFYFYYKKNFKYFFISNLFLLATKENMPLITVMFGIYAFLQKRNRKWYLFSILAGSLWFYLTVFWIIPAFLHKASHGYWGNYSVLLQGPIKILKFLLSGINRNFLFKLFSPLAFLSFLRPDILLLGSPIFLQHMLSSQHTEHTIVRNYIFSLAPFIFISAIFGVKLLRDKTKNLRFSPFIIASYMVIAALPPVQDSIFRLFTEFSKERQAYNSKRWELLENIPLDSSVMSTFVFLPWLSSRDRLYAFHDVYAKIHYGDYKKIPLVEYALIDFNDLYLVDFLKARPDYEKDIRDFFKNNNFGVVKAVNNTLLFKNNYPSQFKLSEQKEHIEFKSKAVILAENKLRGYIEYPRKSYSRDGIIPFTFYWQCLKEMRETYDVVLVLLDERRKEVYRVTHPIGYRIYPTSQWQKGIFIEENFNLILPQLAPGNYSIRVNLLDYKSDSIPQIRWGTDPPERKGDSAVIGKITIQ